MAGSEFAAERLRVYLKERRKEILTDPRLCRALLLDDLEGGAPEAEALAGAIALDIPKRLSRAKSAPPAKIDEMTRELVERRAHRPDAARRVVLTWAAALGKVTDADMVTRLRQMPAAAADAEDRWRTRGAALHELRSGDAARHLAEAAGLTEAERHVLELALKAGVLDRMAHLEHGSAGDRERGRLAASLERRHLLIPVAARWAVDNWALASAKILASTFEQSPYRKEASGEGVTSNNGGGPAVVLGNTNKKGVISEFISGLDFRFVAAPAFVYLAYSILYPWWVTGYPPWYKPSIEDTLEEAFRSHLNGTFELNYLIDQTPHFALLDLKNGDGSIQLTTQGQVFPPTPIAFLRDQSRNWLAIAENDLIDGYFYIDPSSYEISQVCVPRNNNMDCFPVSQAP